MSRMLHLRSGDGLYGADRVVLALAGAAPAPFTSTICSLGKLDALGAAAAQRGLDHVHIPSARPLDLDCARRVAAHARENGIALIHAHEFKSLFVGVLAARLASVPVVATFHGDTDATLKLRAYEAVGRALGNMTSGVVAVSRPLEARLRSWVHLAPVHFIANGIEPVEPPDAIERRAARRALRVDDAATVLAVIGRLAPEKGHATLLRALAKLSPTPTVLIAGDGPERAALEPLARELPVRFLGYRESMREVYAAADAIVLPSLTEGLPLVALEAGMHGRPLVATRVGELAEVLGPDAPSLVPPGDASALAHELQRLCGDRELRTARAERLRERVLHRYSAGAMAQAYAERLWAPALRGSARTPQRAA